MIYDFIGDGAGQALGLSDAAASFMAQWQIALIEDAIMQAADDAADLAYLEARDDKLRRIIYAASGALKSAMQAEGIDLAPGSAGGQILANSCEWLYDELSSSI